MEKNISVVLFDLGRVLMHIDFDAFPNGLGLTTPSLRSQYDQKKVQQTVRSYETGNSSTEEFFDSLYAIFQQQFSREQIRNAFDGIIVSDNVEIVPFVEQIRQQYRIAILSNTCESHWEKVLRISSVIKMFPDTFTSFHLGVMKPEKNIFEKVCALLHVEIGSVIFIDDLQENVDGARAAGMKGIVFHNADQLQKDFQWYSSISHLK
ncbi:MAG: HAD family phosphatase [Bacteroidota bacterium]